KTSSSLCCRLARSTRQPTSLILAITISLRLLDGVTCLGQTSPATLADLQLQTAGDVKAVVLQPDGKLIVAGDFDSVNGVRRKGIVRLNSNGSVDYTWNPSVTGSVFVMALNGTDLYIG